MTKKELWADRKLGPPKDERWGTNPNSTRHQTKDNQEIPKKLFEEGEVETSKNCRQKDVPPPIKGKTKKPERKEMTGEAEDRRPLNHVPQKKLRGKSFVFGRGKGNGGSRTNT